MKQHRWKSESPSETIVIGTAIGRWAKIVSKVRPAVIFLEGNMGAGKTTIARGILNGAGIKTDEFAGSPSYTIVNQYKSDFIINHIDLWRYKSGVDEILIEEFFDYLNAEIAIVEWGNSLRKAVDNYYELQISGGEKRIIEMTAK